MPPTKTGIRAKTKIAAVPDPAAAATTGYLSRLCKSAYLCHLHQSIPETPGINKRFIITHQMLLYLT